MIEREVEADAAVAPLGLKTCFDGTCTRRLEIGIRNKIAIHRTDRVPRVTELRFRITESQLIWIGIATYLSPAQTDFTIRQHLTVTCYQLGEHPRSAHRRIDVHVLACCQGRRLVSAHRGVQVQHMTPAEVHRSEYGYDTFGISFFLYRLLLKARHCYHLTHAHVRAGVDHRAVVHVIYVHTGGCREVEVTPTVRIDT